MNKTSCEKMVYDTRNLNLKVMLMNKTLNKNVPVERIS